MSVDSSTQIAESSANGEVITSVSHHDRIARYYRETSFDYNMVWRSSRNLARHFGFASGDSFGHDAALVSANRHLAELAVVSEGTRVIDCGCGLGGTSLWLARELRAEVTGIELLEDQVSRATREAAQAGLSDRARFLTGDFTATGLESASFEVALAQESLCHVQRKEEFYKEAFRLLVPGGTLLVAEYMRSGRGRSRREEWTLRRWCDGWVMPDLLTQSEHAAAARGSGFSDVEIIDATEEVYASLASLYRSAVLFFPVHRILFALQIRTDVQHSNIISSRLQFEALRRGYWFYGLLRARKIA
jgi:cyclopropane fatty-acyl-phospholipid synthase-like methyltransferase